MLSKGIVVGDTLVGINGVPLSVCMVSPTNSAEISRIIHVAERPFTLHFNELPPQEDVFMASDKDDKQREVCVSV